MYGLSLHTRQSLLVDEALITKNLQNLQKENPELFLKLFRTCSMPACNFTQAEKTILQDKRILISGKHWIMRPHQLMDIIKRNIKYQLPFEYDYLINKATQRDDEIDEKSNTPKIPD